MKPPFPYLFPPPETWETIKAKPKRERRLGQLRDAGVLAVIGGLVLCGAGKGMLSVTDYLRTPTLEHVRPDDVTTRCLITDVLPAGAAGAPVQVRVDYAQKPVGYSEHHSFGPVMVDATLQSLGRASLYTGEMTEPLRAANSTAADKATDYAFEPENLPDGQHQYRVYMNYDITQRANIGHVYNVGIPERSVAANYCGKIELTKQAGMITGYAIIEP